MEMLLVLDSGGLIYVFVLLNGFNIQQMVVDKQTLEAFVAKLFQMYL